MFLLSPARYCFACKRRWQKHTLATMLMGLLLKPPVLLVIGTVLAAYLVTAALSTNFSPWGWVERRIDKYFERKFDSAANDAAASAVRRNPAWRKMNAEQRREFEQYMHNENSR